MKIEVEVLAAAIWNNDPVNKIVRRIDFATLKERSFREPSNIGVVTSRREYESTIGHALAILEDLEPYVKSQV